MVRRGLLSGKHDTISASVPGYVYAQQGDALYVNLYVGSQAEIKMDNGRTVKMVQGHGTRRRPDQDDCQSDKNAQFVINVRVSRLGANRGRPERSLPLPGQSQ